MNRDIKRRLAVACSRGDRQLSLVNELLEGPVHSQWYRFNMYTYLEWGVSKLQNKSYQSLRKRLLQAGFVITRTEVKSRPGDKDWLITMTLPGYEGDSRGKR